MIEAEYHMRDDPRKPLRLYDCLVPTLYKHLKSWPLYEKSHKYARQLVEDEENRMTAESNRMIRGENAFLKEKNQYLTQQAKVIDYYCEVEENGIKISQLKKEIAELETKYQNLSR